MYKGNKIKPYKSSSLNQEEQIKQMFNNVSNKYDLINFILSLGQDIKWRKKLINELYLLIKNPINILDIATGTGDILILLANKFNMCNNIIGLDISNCMLQKAKNKIIKNNLDNRIKLFNHNVEKTFFDSNYFDAITISFGFRNFNNLEKSIKEIYRILKKEGYLMILEFSNPKNFLIKKIRNLYYYISIFFLCKIISTDYLAYKYLIKSILSFPDSIKIKKILKKYKFKICNSIYLTFGTVSLYIVKK